MFGGELGGDDKGSGLAGGGANYGRKLQSEGTTLVLEYGYSSMHSTSPVLRSYNPIVVSGCLNYIYNVSYFTVISTLVYVYVHILASMHTCIALLQSLVYTLLS